MGLLKATNCFNGSDETNSSRSIPVGGRPLRAFTILSRAGKFSLAARQLHLTWSAMSHSMKALEQTVGCRFLSIVCKNNY